MSTSLFKTSVFGLSLLALAPVAGGANASDNEGEKEFQQSLTVLTQNPSQLDTELQDDNFPAVDVQGQQQVIEEDPLIKEFCDENCYNLDLSHFEGTEENGQEKFTSTKINMAKECGNILIQGLAILDFVSRTSDVAKKLEKGQINPDSVDTVAKEIDKTAERTKSIAKSATLVAGRAGFYIDKVTPVLAGWGNALYPYFTTTSSSSEENKDSSNGEPILLDFEEESGKESDDEIIKEFDDVQY